MLNNCPKYALVLLLTVSVAWLASAIASRATQQFSCFTSECWRRADVTQHPRALPNIALQNSQGETTPLNSLCAKVLVVNFIYTRCKTVCSSAGNVSSQLATRLAPQIKAGKVQVVSISFDPAHDTPERLSAYQQRLDRSGGLWQVARPTTVAANAEMMRTFGVVAIDDGLGGFNHNAALHIVDNTCHLVKIDDITEIAEVEQDVKKLL